METNYHFEPLSAANFHHFEWLYDEVFQKKSPPGYLKTKYETPLNEGGYCAWIALEKPSGQPVSFYGALPWRLTDGTNEIRAVQTCDSITLASHRGQKLFTQLHEKVVPVLQEQKYSFLFGFPNQTLFPVLKFKQGWEFFGHLQLFTLKISSPIPKQKIANKLKGLSGWNQKRLDRIISPYSCEPFETSALVHGYNGGLRNPSWIDYKTTPSHYFIELAGNKFWIKITNHLVIGDTLVQNPNGFAQSLSLLQQLGRKVGTDQVYFLCSKGTLEFDCFAQYVAPQDTLPIGFLPLNDESYDFNRFKFTLSDVDTF